MGRSHPFLPGRLSRIEINSIQIMRHRLASPLILAISRPDGHYTVEADADDKKIGCSLMRKTTEKLKKHVGTDHVLWNCLNSIWRICLNRHITQSIVNTLFFYCLSHSCGRISMYCGLLTERTKMHSNEYWTCPTQQETCRDGAHDYPNLASKLPTCLAWNIRKLQCFSNGVWPEWMSLCSRTIDWHWW